MDKTLSKDRVKEIIQKAPPGTSPAGIIAGLRQKGYQMEGYPTQEPTQTPEQQADIKSAEEYKPLIPAKTSEGVFPAVGKTVANLPSSAWGMVKGLGSALIHPVKTIQGVSSLVVGAEQRGLGALTRRKIETQDTGTFDALVQKMKDDYGTPENIQRKITNDPVGFATDLMTVVGGGASMIGKGGDASKLISTTAKPVITGTQKVTELSKPLLEKSVAKFTKDIGAPLVQKLEKPIGAVQNAISRANVPEKFETSVQRLATPKPNVPLAEVKSPLAKYDEYLKQEEAFKKDIKADTAISKVGEDIGNKFDEVINQRRNVGKTMGDEIKKIGTKKIDVSDSFPKFEQELSDSGVTFSNGKVKLSNVSKITSQDASMLNDYIQKLNKLGANPSASELDAFLSRTPNEIKIYKAKNNILDTTNAERMVKANLRELTNNLTKDPSLAKYAEARKQYANLSDFLDEGESYLGKKTQAGDYAKDASIAKSSVQSILNNGKKDWLLKLEDLTGYPAVDNSMLALQAMKDSGNFRGLSLLETLSTGGVKIPTPKNIFGKTLEFGLEKGKEALAGTPAEQTRRSIQQSMRSVNPMADLQEIQNSARPMANTNAIKTNIDTTIPQTPKKSNLIQGLKKKFDETPNKQGGFVKNPLAPQFQQITKDAYSVSKKATPEQISIIDDWYSGKSNDRDFLQTMEELGVKSKNGNILIEDLTRFAKDVLDEKLALEKKSLGTALKKK
jgi:SepF-like predicted cell division protein (DUF552 family)